MPKRIKHNDLTHYFLRQHSELPRAYLASCEKFFNSIKQRAPSSEPQAASNKQVTSKPDYDIIKTERKYMKTQEALKLVGGLSKPSKMPGWAYGIPAKECKTGKKLQNVEGSTCYNCYALKGCYVFKVVQEAQYRRLGSIKHPYWVRAMVHLLQSKKSKYFRWHDSGDVQDLKHLAKIFEVARRTPDVQHWMPTREAWVKPYLQYAPDNLVIRFSMPMVDQPAQAPGPIHLRW
jgi:hypothetical protein